MSIEELPCYFKYWGKARKDEITDEYDYHLLVYHCLDVAAVATVWLSESNTLLRQISRHLKLSGQEAKDICIFFILLHDLGKFDARFQHFCEEIRSDLQGDAWLQPDLLYYSHGSCGYKQFCESYGTNEAMKAVAGHHGYCDTSFDYDEPDADDWIIEQDEHAREQWVKFCLAFCKLEQIPNVGEIPMLAGLCCVSDWIGSSITSFKKNTETDLAQYFSNLLPKAKKALIEAGLLKALQGSGFEFLFPNYTPRGVQSLLDKMPLETGLTLVESDTGSGKTEFALAYASMLINNGLADGIVFGLPTQATANGLFDRIGEATEKLFPEVTPTLAHGKSKYLITDESGFLHKSNKRAFLGTVSVATIDQILMGVLCVRHQFVRSFGTRKSVLILDEIHSFDAYMMGLIEQILKGQHQAFSSVILLSATLPNVLKKKLLSCYNGISESREYPLISHTDLQGNTREFELDSNQKKSIEKKVVSTQIWHSNNLLPNDAQLNQIVQWVKLGSVVGIVCNTVKDAQRLFSVMKSHTQSIAVDLFHARYAFGDRKNRESEVLKNYGKHSKRQGRLLIATQVIEQSLDLDFDVLISQIAPIEYLMQRMGRLWRHDRVNSSLMPRTGNIHAPLFITILPEDEFSNDFKQKQAQQHYLDSGYVYQNIRLLYRTGKYLNQNPKLVFPKCYRSAINYVHSEESFDDEPKVLSDISEEYSIKATGSHYTAKLISNLPSKPLNDVDPRCAMLTREGEMSETVVLFKHDQTLLHGGDYNDLKDRDRSTVALARKHTRGKKDENNFCYKAVIGKDIAYNEMGVIAEDLIDELYKGS